MRNWLHNHSTESKPGIKLSFLRPFTAKSVFQEEERADIVAPLHQKGIQGSRKWLPAYNKRVNELWKDMSEEKVKRYQETAWQWNREGAPASVQARYVQSLMCSSKLLISR